jgi:hypothetical protein
MKKIFVILILAVSQISCLSKVVDPLAGCEKASEDFLKAAEAFTSDPTSKPKCENYKKSFEDYVKSCPTLGVVTRDNLKAALDSFNCNDLN